MISLTAMKSLVNAILVFLLIIRQRGIKTNQERFEFIVTILVAIAAILI